MARIFRVALSTVQLWVGRAGKQRLDRVDFSDRSHSAHHLPRKTEQSLEERVLSLRQELKQSVLGEYGAAAIHHALVQEGRAPIPCERTIHRILARNGTLDALRRQRRQAPPPGWHLPDVVARQAELDEIDIVSGLVITGGVDVETLNMVSVHGGLVDSFVARSTETKRVRDALLSRWRQHGLPGYAQFDNDTRFLGPSNRADILGTVPRMCLSLGVVPVFAPPREVGFQAAIESYNRLWQEKVWDRLKHLSVESLAGYSDRYVAASHQRHSQRVDAAPARKAFPRDWQLTKELLQAYPSGLVVFIRRTDDQGMVNVLGHRYSVGEHWVHRLVRCDMDLTAGHIRFYALRRADHANQHLLTEASYQFPQKRFKVTDMD